MTVFRVGRSPSSIGSSTHRTFRSIDRVIADEKLHRSHPDVAEKHYPDLFKQFFPYGMPTHGTAY